jgi:5'-nucleotidase
MVKWNTKLVAASLLGCAVAATGCGNANKKAAAQNPAAISPMNQAALDVPAAPAAPPASPAAPPVEFNPTPPPQPVVYDPASEQQPASDEPIVEAYEPAVAETPAVRARPTRKPAARVASASAGKTKYKVKKGESLWSIAQTRYGNGNKWKSIAAANPRIDPNRVQAGQTIVLP